MVGRHKPLPGRRLTSTPARTAPSDSGQFRRNRTFVGDRYQPAEESSRAKLHHLSMTRRKVGIVLLVVLIAAGLLALLLSQLTATVTVARSSTQIEKSIDGAHYQAIVSQYLGLHPVSRLRFALNEPALGDYATQLAPEVEAIGQTSSGELFETHFVITFRRPVAGWQINGKQFYVDQYGIVFEKNYYASPGLQIVDETGASPQQGSAVASSRLLSFVGKVVALSRAGGYKVTKAVLPAGTTRQLQVTLEGVRPTVTLSIDRGAGEQVEDMTQALNHLRSKHISARYVDVRVSGRAAYK